MGTLGNVPLASAHGRCTAAALSCIQRKAHHEFHVPHVIIEYLQYSILHDYIISIHDKNLVSSDPTTSE